MCRRDPVGFGRRIKRELIMRRERAYEGRGSRRTMRPHPLPVSMARVVDPARFLNSDSVVVIVTDSSVRAEVTSWLKYCARGTVHVISGDSSPEWDLESYGAVHHRGASLSAIAQHLRWIGAVDVLIDLIPHSVAEQRETFTELFFNLKPGGVYLADPKVGRTETFSHLAASWLTMLIESNDAEEPARSARDRELSTSTAWVNISRDLIVIEKRYRHYLKLRDRDTNRTLPLREKKVSLDVLDRVPGGVLESPARVTSHESSLPITALDTTMEYPDLYLRHYRGKIAMVSNALLHADYTILPDSFRHHLEKNPRNPRIASASTRFARIPAHLRPKDILPGSYYHLDSENSGHFGHLMTEVTSRLWGWDHAKKALPELKAIYRVRYPNERDPAVERKVFEAFGILPDDMVWLDHPAYVQSIVAATPMWHNKAPHYVNPRIQETWDRLGNSLIDPSAPGYPKIFVSRRVEQKNRHCRNSRAVEAFFAYNGFEIIYPELFDLSVQAGIFSKARVIAGFGGSAMSNILFARNVSTVILLSHEAYTARNEHLFTCVLGCDVHYFWSDPDISHPEGGYAWQAFYSNWEFDFERNGPILQNLLDNLSLLYRPGAVRWEDTSHDSEDDSDHSCGRSVEKARPSDGFARRTVAPLRHVRADLRPGGRCVGGRPPAGRPVPAATERADSRDLER
jgi:capsular polysaccharide biosynthesis protein